MTLNRLAYLIFKFTPVFFKMMFPRSIKAIKEINSLILLEHIYYIKINITSYALISIVKKYFHSLLS